MKKDIKVYSNTRKTVHLTTSQLCVFAGKNDYIEMTEWTNGDGYDIQICRTIDILGTKNINLRLTTGEVEAIKELHNQITKE
jgi:hypothetical protein